MLSEEIETRLAQERRARLAAERLLAQKQRELSAANEELSRHAFKLSDQIVEQRHEAEELKDENFQVRSDLQRAEQRLWTSFETIEDGFAVFDSARRLVLANPAYLSAFDGLEDVRTGVAYADLLRLAVEEGVVDTEGLGREEWCAMMLGRWSSRQIDPIVVRLWNGNSVKLVERRGEDGDIVTLALNITETIRREQALTEARHRAEAASRAKSAFLANMSHELRTPMNGVVGMAQLLSEGHLDEEQQLYVDTIRQSGEALLHIINEVLDYSKMEAEKLELHVQPFNLERLLHDVVLLSLPAAQEKGVNIALDFDMFLPGTFVGDQGRLRQVLTNLIGNAVKFTAQGHVAIRVIGLDTDANGQEIIVNVEDTGIGISPEMAGHIFGEFNQAEDERNRNYEGTGLGLAITKRLVELMGGEIWVDSELGRGSCFSFRVRLPVAEEAGDTRVDGAIPPLSRALVVDPDGLSRDVLFKQLAGYGIDVVHVATLDEAKELIARGSVPFDVVLADAALPDDGATALARHIADGAAPLPVVLICRKLAAQIPAKDRALFFAAMTRPALRSDLWETLRNVAAQRPLLLEGKLPDEAPVEAEPAASGMSPDAPFEEPGPFFAARRRGGMPLPDAAAPPDPTRATTPDAPLLPALPPQGSGAPRQVRVLAAEDNRTNQLVFRKMLRDLNIDLRFAANGEEAVALYEAFEPDLVFMDISMPKMDGMEATRRIREIERVSGRHVPVTAMTAHAMDGDAERILAAGLDHYLTKPLKKALIIDKLEELLPDGCAPLRIDTAAE